MAGGEWCSAAGCAHASTSRTKQVAASGAGIRPASTRRTSKSTPTFPEASTRAGGARRDVKRLGGEAVVLPLDVADPEAVERAAAEVEVAFGPIGRWINNAMVIVFSPVRAIPPDEFRR